MIWKTVPGYEWLEASSDGEIRRTVAGLNGYPRVGHIYRQAILPNKGTPYRILNVIFNGVRHHFRVNRVVCSAFHGLPPSPQHQAAHKDGNSLRNAADNLYWATHVENYKDRDDHGKLSRGESHYCAKLTEMDVVYIREMIGLGVTCAHLGRKFGVSHSTIQHIKKGRSWAT